MRTRPYLLMFCSMAAAVTLMACGGQRPAPTTTPQPPPTVTDGTPVTPTPPMPGGNGTIVDSQPLAGPLPEEGLDARSLDDLNRDSPLRPAFFPLDSADLDDAGRTVVAANAEVLKRYPSWVITIEGHCDERGTAEYNLALGERRATAARNYLLSLGIPAARLRTASYGDEYPFDRGHTEDSWSKNRRAHFVITAK